MSTLRCHVIQLEIGKKEDEIKIFSDAMSGIQYLKNGQKRRNENWRNTSKCYLSMDWIDSGGTPYRMASSSLFLPSLIPTWNDSATSR